jgi:hypothetical protein
VQGAILINRLEFRAGLCVVLEALLSRFLFLISKTEVKHKQHYAVLTHLKIKLLGNRCLN